MIGPAPTPLRDLLRALAAAALMAASSAAAQPALTPFSRGGPIEADELNRNFEELADAVGSLATGVVRIDPFEMAPLRSSTEYLRFKGELVLTGDSDAGDPVCFGTVAELPDGAEILAFAARLSVPENGSENTVAEAFLGRRAWDGRSTEWFSTVEAQGPDYQEDVSLEGLPVVVDREAGAYRVATCLGGDGGFLGARIEYAMP